MAKKPVKTQGTSQESEGDEAALKKFQDDTFIGDFFLYYDSWSAWAVMSDKKVVAPFVSVALGDERGNVVFNRPLLITAVSDLIEELADTLVQELSKGKDLGVTFELPGSLAVMIRDLEQAKELIDTALASIRESTFIKEASR